MGHGIQLVKNDHHSLATITTEESQQPLVACDIANEESFARTKN